MLTDRQITEAAYQLGADHKDSNTGLNLNSPELLELINQLNPTENILTEPKIKQVYKEGYQDGVITLF